MSKDQVTARPRCDVCATPNSCGGDGKCLEEYITLRLQPVQPDCRTCEYMRIDIDLEKAASKESCARPGGAVCVNGSLHREAPRVVLWRTE